MQDQWHSRLDSKPLRGEYTPPGDAIISHLALVFGALSLGPTRLSGTLENNHTVATRRFLSHLGVMFSRNDEGELVITKPGRELTEPQVELDCGASAMTMSLALALLAGQPFSAVLTGSQFLQQTSFAELLNPLRQMGASIECLAANDSPPFRVHGSQLQPLEIELNNCTCCFKPALLLAALLATGTSRLSSCLGHPDHAERLLRLLGVSIRRDGLNLLLRGEQHIHPRHLRIPPDMTAAAPFIATAALKPGSELLLRQVGANPGRSGFLKTLQRCGADVRRVRDWQFGTEPVSSFHICYAAELAPFNAAPNLTPCLMAELPSLALAATQISGTSSLRGALTSPYTNGEYLRSIQNMLSQFGAEVEVDDRGFTIVGPLKLLGGEIKLSGDPRIDMMALVAADLAEGTSVLTGTSSLSGFYPGLLDDFTMLTS